MACFHPIPAYQSVDGSVFFVERGADFVRRLDLPCGQCVGCRLERSRQWAVRCVHEAAMHEENCFVTLTYAETGPSLVYRDFQLFMKRLRKYAPRRVRFYMCGEYTPGDPVEGVPGGRPHFHALLFGVNFHDRKLFTVRNGVRLYTSKGLSTLWPLGFSTVGDVTFESAAYCARYIMKKLTGDGEAEYYNIFDPETGEIWVRTKEFCHMSLKPGIGAGWLSQHLGQVARMKKVVSRGVQVKLPKYYDRKIGEWDPDALAAIQFERALEMAERHADNTDARLKVREQVTAARVSLLTRGLE